MSGWGSGGWGSSFWGLGSDPLSLLRVQPIRENVVRAEFSEAPLFNRILDAHDASNPQRWTITPIPGTVGSDELPTRVVKPVAIAVFGGGGSQIDVTTDRPFSPFPARYILSVNNLIAASSGALLASGATSLEFDGLFKVVPPPRRDLSIPSRDVANPQTFQALLDPLPNTSDPNLLGTIIPDDRGDYAFDEGNTNLKKRVLRRILSSKNRFAHLPGYGVGLAAEVKKLATAAKRSAIAAEAEKQIALEPDVQSVSVKIVGDGRAPGLFRLRIRVKSRTNDEQEIDLPVPGVVT